MIKSIYDVKSNRKENCHDEKKQNLEVLFFFLEVFDLFLQSSYRLLFSEQVASNGNDMCQCNYDILMKIQTSTLNGSINFVLHHILREKEKSEKYV